MTQTAGIEQEIRAFVEGADMANRPVEVKEDLLTGGALDSLSIARLIAFLEERFGIEVPIRDILPENVGTVAAMTGYVSARRSGTAAKA